LQANIYTSLDELTQMWQCNQTFSPKIDKQFRDKLYGGWLEAVRKVQTNYGVR